MEEVENIRDRKESLKKVKKVVGKSANEWMQDGLKEKVLNHIEMKDTHEHLEKMLANYEIKRSDVGTISTLAKLTEEQQSKALQKLSKQGKKRKGRIGRALASLKEAAGGPTQSNVKNVGLQFSKDAPILKNGLINGSQKSKKKQLKGLKPTKAEKARASALEAKAYALQNCKMLDPGPTVCPILTSTNIHSRIVCSTIVCELIEKAMTYARTSEDNDVSEDEIEFVMEMSRVSKKRPSAWDLLTPTPKLDQPRPPARYGGMGQFLSQLLSVGVTSDEHDDMDKCRQASKETWHESDQLKRTSVENSISPEPNFGNLRTSEVTTGDTTCEEPAKHFLRLPKTGAADSCDQPVQPQRPAVATRKYTCRICGTKFSKEMVLQFHMAVHK